MKVIEPTPTDKLIGRLTLMAESGGMLTKDRIRTIQESAGRMRELDEAVRILREDSGGDADEEH